MAQGYVAAKFEQAALAKFVMNLLEDQGYEITHDWTEETTEGLAGIEVLETLQVAALDDIDGVKRADFLVWLQHPKCKGALGEVGAALVLNKPVIIVGPGPMLDFVFTYHPNVTHVSNVDEAFQVLKTLFPAGVLTQREIDEAAEKALEEQEQEQEGACQCGECSTPEPFMLFDLGKVGVA